MDIKNTCTITLSKELLWEKKISNVFRCKKIFRCGQCQTVCGQCPPINEFKWIADVE